MVSLKVPVATYRLQLNQGFSFKDAQAIVPYLDRLGITDLYTSPILKARKGSLHGYDVTDPTSLNYELGGEPEFESLVQKLRTHKMGLLLDIVPNHIAASPENKWWMDILENGRVSPYATYFDIDWNPASHSLKNKVLLPILGDIYNHALKNREFTLIMEETGFFIDYHGYKLPLYIKSYATIINYRLDILEAILGPDHPSFRLLMKLVKAIKNLPPSTNHSDIEFQQDYLKRQQIKKDLLSLVNSSPEITSFLSENIALFNGEGEDYQSFKLLGKLLSQQAYQPIFWKTALAEINYRRFFNINDLIGVRVEEYQVFRATHDLILQLIREGKVTGLRIDHIDGLYDPLGYLHKLQQHIIPTEEIDRFSGFYIVVEKILSSDETLPEEWSVYGTTGYDFLNIVNRLFVDEKGVQQMKTVYSNFTGSELAFEDIVYHKKKQVIHDLFTSEISALGQKLSYLSKLDCFECNFSQEEVEKTLIEITACLLVYRTYIYDLKVSEKDRIYLELSIEEVQRRNPTTDHSILEFVKRIILLDFPTQLSSEYKEEWLHFIRKWQQFTGVVMAKGVEDTAFYNYNFLISLNEVGGNPGETISSNVSKFHRYNISKQSKWPYALLATTTHDTKRAEDVRARLNILSEMPGAWERRLSRWKQWNHRKKPSVNGRCVPDPNMDILIYQTLLGAWPLSNEEVPEFKKRMRAYMLKAAREAKAHTSWLSPNSDYESALLTFMDSILEDSEQNRFLKDFLEFHEKLAYYGALNSLAQVLLKIASPGIPDFYQGTELWDFSLVDPDNRRSIDFVSMMSHLDKLIEQESVGQKTLSSELLHSWKTGKIKLYITYRLLNARRAHREIFLEGDYIPLEVKGKRKEHVCAFARHLGNHWALVAVPRLLTGLVTLNELPLGYKVWEDDVLILPDSMPEHLSNIFTGEFIKLSLSAKKIPLADIFYGFPIALLLNSSLD